MKLAYGSPALSLLLRLKLRGSVRRQIRRLKTPKGFVLTLLGTLVLALWLGSLALSFHQAPTRLDPFASELRVRAFGLMLFLMSLSTALTNRGLYLQKSEIERLFSAPVSRRDLVRYRLLANGLRSLLGGVILGMFSARRMPDPPLAFAGIMLSMQTLPVLNQLVAIALGGLEQRSARTLKRVGTVMLGVLFLLLAVLVIAWTGDRPLHRVPLVGTWLTDLAEVRGDLFAHPVLASATVLFAPWARMISAPTPAAFAPWFGLCLALHALLLELCARLPFDFRELSLATSARAAARVARVRKGGGVASTRASATTVRWRIPWFFGRGPAGAIAWRKCVGMTRKAKGAFWVSLVALLFITVVVNLLADSVTEGELPVTPFLLAFLGTVYLCSGLRFDFREELERMDVVRTWPLSPARLFLAMLLPEVLLVSILVGGTVLVHALVAGTALPHALGVTLCLPMLVLDWVAVDNIVFLFSPVRWVPGHDGFFQNTGRRLIQMLLLFVLVGPPLALAGLGWVVLRESSLVVAYGSAAVILGTSAMVLAWLGGAVLRRFDVARDRG